MTRSLAAYAIAIVLSASVLTGCNRSTPESEAASAAVIRIQAIPAADPAKYQGMTDMKNWRNPYLIIRPEGVGLLDVANYEQHILKPDELLPALAALPRSAWPYGRVVALTESGLRKIPGEDDAAIRKNRGIIAGTLESAHVAINWVPPA